MLLLLFSYSELQENSPCSFPAQVPTACHHRKSSYDGLSKNDNITQTARSFLRNVQYCSVDLPSGPRASHGRAFPRPIRGLQQTANNSVTETTAISALFWANTSATFSALLPLVPDHSQYVCWNFPKEGKWINHIHDIMVQHFNTTTMRD